MLIDFKQFLEPIVHGQSTRVFAKSEARADQHIETVSCRTSGKHCEQDGNDQTMANVAKSFVKHECMQQRASSRG